VGFEKMAVEQILAANEKAMNFEPKAVNYPINLGFPAPARPGQYELAIIGHQNEKREAIARLMRIFEASGATVVSITFSNFQSPEQFVMNVVCNLDSEKCPPDELLIRINKSKFVKVAEMSSLEKRIFGRYSFPLTFFGEVRALAIDADRFVHLFDDITKMFGAPAKTALFENGRAEGGEIVQALMEMLGPNAKRDLLLENAKALFQTAGWGRLAFYTEGVDIYKATITEPPSDADEGAILENYFLQGLVAGVLEPFLKSGVKLSMIREGYDEEKKNLILYYMDKASLKELASDDEKFDNVPLPESKLANENPSKQEESRAEDPAVQVDRIIKSIDEIEGQIEPQTKEIASTDPVQGEIVGSGVQIVQQTERPPVPRRRKKANHSAENAEEAAAATDKNRFEL
jgi:hypothetical protein